MHLGVGVQFREYLRGELKSRVEQNPRYSLRSFARSLAISPAGLSTILSGKAPVTLKFVEKIAPKLKLGPEQIQSFQIQILSDRSRLNLQMPDFEFIDAERFSVIKEWYHYAILNLLRTKSFQPRAAWIARRLGITLPEVQSAIDKLQRVGLLKIVGGKWVDLSSQFTSHADSKKFNEAARQNQLELFAKARASIDNDPFELRNHTGSSVALNLSQLEEVKQFITKFRKEFMRRFDKKSNADEVYHISIGLFSLTNTRGSK